MARTDRFCASSSLSLPALTFGSMRFDPARIEARAGRDLLAFLFDAGCNSFHSSHEYEFHDYFCTTLRSLGRRPARHVVKLGEPHFDHAGFRPRRMIEIIDEQLRLLGVEHIDVVQWLLRHTPLEDRYRLPLFEACRDEVAATALRLQEAGKIGCLTVFPYTTEFAEAALGLGWCDGLTSYLNPVERECVPYLDAMEGRGQFFLAIRPLYAGLLASGAHPEGAKFAVACDALGISPAERLAFALRYPMLHPAVKSVILSVNTISQAEAALAAVGAGCPDTALFDRANAAFAAAGL